ncbi:hypothetical protein [Paenibacillus humicus]|uniref:hypothetical protein n=1 Tax=Paenibacillus humicus TaxID=412861 RepID=UPI000FD8158E|nr:hypothetical protein [Paenibacillus humicus]
MGRASLIRLRLAILPVLALLAVMSGPCGTALANGGPVYEPAEGFGPMRLEHSESLLLIREKVSYFIPDDATVRYGPFPEVTVDYELHNGGKDPQQVEVLFLYPDGDEMEGLRVTENGEAQVPVTPASEDSLKGLIGRPTIRPTIMEPFSGMPLVTRSSNHGVGGGRFPLEFRAGETKRILISYRDPGGWEESAVVNRVGSHLYYLSPASYWAGKPKVELEVRLADRSSRLSSNIPMNKEGPGLYRAFLSELPEEEWVFSHASGHRLLLPLNRQPEYNRLVLLIAGIGGSLTALLAARLRRLWIAWLGAVFWTALVIGSIADMGGYPFQLILIPSVYGANAAFQLAVAIAAGRRIRRRRSRGRIPLDPDGPTA